MLYLATLLARAIIADLQTLMLVFRKLKCMDVRTTCMVVYQVLFGRSIPQRISNVLVLIMAQHALAREVK